MIVYTKPLAEITQGAPQVLHREIGLVNTVRFLSQFTFGFGDHTEERGQLFQSMAPDDIVTGIKNRKGSEHPT